MSSTPVYVTEILKKFEDQPALCTQETFHLVREIRRLQKIEDACRQVAFCETEFRAHRTHYYEVVRDRHGFPETLYRTRPGK